MTMIERHYTVRFLTPAFLGNAEQNGQWRTPPFKSLLRQWWRVAVAKDFNYSHTQRNKDGLMLREVEGKLFGNAWLKQPNGEADFSKSRVRIRLDDWSHGTQTSAPAIGNVTLGKNSIPASLYAGYGPVVQGPRLKANAAIQATATDTTPLRLAFPEGAHIEQALALIQHFGCLGGRSRNGWGSFELQGDLPSAPFPLMDWRAAMQRDWAHAIGKDEQGALIWESRPQSRWEDAMRLLAQTRADMRRKVPDRLMLAYPDTKGVMPGWKATDRVPNSLRFKVRSQGSQFVGVVFHMPCRPADELWNKLAPAKQSQFPDCFAAAHRYLDSNTSFIPRHA